MLYMCTAYGHNASSVERQHRQAKQFKRVGVIALAPWSPNLPLIIDENGEDEEDDSTDEDSDSDESDKAMSDVMSEPPSTAMGDASHTGPASSGRSASKPFALTKAQRTGMTKSSTIAQAIRLMVNITPHGEYPTSAPAAMVTVLQSLQNLEKLMRRGVGDQTLTIWHVVTAAEISFTPALLELLNFAQPHDDGYQQAAETKVYFGPYGFGAVADFLSRLLDDACRQPLSSAEFQHVYTYVENAATSMRAHILAFRSHWVRDEYDPDGVARLVRVMRDHRAKFPNRDVFDDGELTSLRLDMATVNVEVLVAALVTDFGSTNTPSDIRSNSLTMGPEGIDGFMDHVVYYIVDTLPTDAITYIPLLAIVQEFCLTLAGKMEGFSKADGKKPANKKPKSKGKKRKASGPLEDPAPPPGGSGYGTRSKGRAPSAAEDGPGDSEGEGGPSMGPADAASTESDSSYDEDNDSPDYPAKKKQRPEVFGERRKFPYPSPHAEEPYRTKPPTPPAASPPPTPCPRPRPRARVPGDVRHVELDKLHKIIGARILVQTVLTYYPHPDAQRCVSWDSVKDLPMDINMLKQLSMVYHPDRSFNKHNVSDEWKEAVLMISQALNAKLSDH
ncbi:hypothetical protein C8F01DRAFT_1301734 [Mycena amicta]|nr:hypothetical protein C8F01DRAFT_1301734 [Mycena amicta]